MAAVDEEGRQIVAERRRGVVKGMHGERQVTVPVVPAAVGARAQRVADDAQWRCWRSCGTPTTRHEPQPLTKARNTSLMNLESCSTKRMSGKPSSDRRHMSRMISAASSAVAVERVGTACTLQDSRSTWFWMMSNPAAGVGRPAIQATPIIPPRRDGRGRGWMSPHGPCYASVRESPRTMGPKPASVMSTPGLGPTPVGRGWRALHPPPGCWRTSPPPCAVVGCPLDADGDEHRWHGACAAPFREKCRLDRVEPERAGRRARHRRVGRGVLLALRGGVVRRHGGPDGLREPGRCVT